MAFPTDEILKAFIGLSVGGLIGREVFRRLDKPNVIVQYEDLVRFTQNDGVYLSMRVGNVGRSAATECICTLSLFDLPMERILNPTLANAFENLPEYKEEKIDLDFPRYQVIEPSSECPIVSASLCWSSLGNPPSLSLNPGTARNFDICKFVRGKKGDYFVFPSEFGWRRVRVRVTADAPLRGRLMVCPANDYPTPLDFEIWVEDGEPRFRRVPVSIRTRFRRLLSRRYLYAK